MTFVEDTTDKTFQALVDDRTEVSIETGLRAAEKLQAASTGMLGLLAGLDAAARLTVRRQPGISRYRTDVASGFSKRW